MALAQVPQIQASITISSPNITNTPIQLSVTSRLRKAGTSDSIDQVDGVNRKSYSTAQTNTVLIDAADYGSGAHKVYIKNTSVNATDVISLTLGSGNLALGGLYGGDWAFLPWDGANDIKITTTVASVVEFAVFYQ